MPRQAASVGLVVSLWGLLAACTESFFPIPPPPSGLSSVLLSFEDGEASGVIAYALGGDTGSPIGSLSSSARIEAAVFAASLDELGLRAGSVESSSMADPLRAKDADEHYRLELTDTEGIWVETDRLSARFGSFALPVAAPEAPCPDFELENVMIEQPGFTLFGTPGPGGTLLLGGLEVVSVGREQLEFGEARLYQIGTDLLVERIEVSPALDVVRAVTREGRGFWSDNGTTVYQGEVRMGRLELEASGSTLSADVRSLAGDGDDPNQLYAVIRGAKLVRRVGEGWLDRADVDLGTEWDLAQGEGGAVFVSDAAFESVWVGDEGVKRTPVSQSLAQIQFVPGFGFIAADSGSIFLLSESRLRWDVLAESPAPGSSVGGFAAYRDGFVVVYDSTLFYWSPTLKTFCPPFDMPYPSLANGQALGDALAIWPASKGIDTSLHVLVLRDRNRRAPQ